jgi:hypothetical protein
MWQNKRQLFALLFEASAATLLEVAADPKHLGARIGLLAILHTWGQTLQPHPHIHCVLPGGGLSPDPTHWISSPSHFFLPVKVLSRVFRGKFVAGLRRAFRNHQLVFFGECLPLGNEKNFTALLRSLFQQDWVVYAKPPFGGPEHVLHYLARYTHRVAISNHRLLSVSDSGVAFRWKDVSARQQAAHHDPLAGGVPAPLPPPCAAQRLPPYPLLRLVGQPHPQTVVTALPPPAPPTTTGNKCIFHEQACHLAVPSLPRPHARDRTTHRGAGLLRRNQTHRCL